MSHAESGTVVTKVTSASRYFVRAETGTNVTKVSEGSKNRSYDSTLELALQRNGDEKVKQTMNPNILGIQNVFIPKATVGTPVDLRYFNPPSSGSAADPPFNFLDDEDSSLSAEEVDIRETWTGKLDFLLSCIGFAVGLGNIWRFPYLCYASGGGAFLIPYLTFLAMCGLPLFFLETSYGQFASLSPITVWRLCPLFKGIGYGMVIISGIVCVYYNIIITWTFYYLFSSMQSTLPWSGCDNHWNTPRCSRSLTTNNETRREMLKIQNSLMSERVRAASEEFWEFNVLERTRGLEEFGSLRWPLFWCLVLAWFVVFLCLCKGVKSSGKVVYVTATFPYLVLTILLVRGLSLPGAKSGIKWYLIPQWHKLASFKVWGDAATQIFFSVGMAWGSLITLASYNRFNNNVFRDAMIVPSINCFTSVFAGLVIFSVLGFMSDSTGVPIEKVVTEGPGLIFIVYPEAVAKMPFSHLWAILFFLMIFTIGLDSQFGMFETMTSAFIDEYPMFLRKKKVKFTAFMCLIEFCLGIPMVYQGGFYLLTLMDAYSSCFSLMLLSLIECLVISWIYGVDRFMKDIQLMIGSMPSTYWKYMWQYITPAIVIFTWTFSLYHMKRVKLDNYNYPDWSIALGWFMALLSIMPLPICAAMAISSLTKGTLTQKTLLLIQPSLNYGPANIENRDRFFKTFDEFDWIRYNATRAGLDWRTYNRRLRESNINFNRRLTSTGQRLETSGCPSDSCAVKILDASQLIPRSSTANDVYMGHLPSKLSVTRMTEMNSNALPGCRQQSTTTETGHLGSSCEKGSVSTSGLPLPRCHIFTVSSNGPLSPDCEVVNNLDNGLLPCQLATLQETNIPVPRHPPQD